MTTPRPQPAIAASLAAILTLAGAAVGQDSVSAVSGGGGGVGGVGAGRAASRATP
ncbi:MAG: hypothetical protein JNK35_05585 [Phycisphaerae bacterium]|nr:hypothetical protein [Phycisphaerae bacterium]